MWDIPRVRALPVVLPRALLPTLLAVLVGIGLVAAWRGHVDGRILAIGGTVVAGSPPRGMVLASVERYDPATNGWSDAASMVAPRVGHTATRLLDGRVLVVGGGIRAGPGAELYDPVADRWI